VSEGLTNFGGFNVTRFLSGHLLVVVAVFFGPIGHAHALHPALAEVAKVLGVEAAKLAIDTATANTMSQFGTKVVSTEITSRDTAGYLALPTTILVTMRADQQGKTVFRDSEHANICLTLRVKVEVVAMYPLKDIQNKEGQLLLPENPKILTGFIEPEGKRGTWEYTGSWLIIPWTDDHKNKVARQLAFEALEAAKKDFNEKDVLKNLEYQFKQSFDQEIDRIATSKLKVHELTQALSKP